LNPVLPEYGAGVLTIQPQRSVPGGFDVLGGYSVGETHHYSVLVEKPKESSHVKN
jgi:hypothetical protein